MNKILTTILNIMNFGIVLLIYTYITLLVIIDAAIGSQNITQHYEKIIACDVHV